LGRRQSIHDNRGAGKGPAQDEGEEAGEKSGGYKVELDTEREVTGKGEEGGKGGLND